MTLQLQESYKMLSRPLTPSCRREEVQGPEMRSVLGHPCGPSVIPGVLLRGSRATCRKVALNTEKEGRHLGRLEKGSRKLVLQAHFLVPAQ